jgi:lactoylglutathione lyase
MLSKELLTINKTVQGEIGTMEALRWFIQFDTAKQREIVSMTRICLERASPSQEGVDRIIDSGHLNLTPHQLDIFIENHYSQAIIKTSEVTDDELGDSFYALITLYRHFDELERKTICKKGCDHEWHNLTWNIRTNDIQKLVDFYTLTGLKLDYHKHGTSFHYSVQTGQSKLNIYALTKTQKDMGLTLRIKFALDNYDEVLKTFKEKAVPFLHQPETGLMAVVLDPDGRKIELHKS